MADTPTSSILENKNLKLSIEIVLALVLLGALGDQPASYYQNLRILVFLGGAYLTNYYKSAHVFAIPTAVMAILFNPILPFSFDKDTWGLFNGGFACLLVFLAKSDLIKLKQIIDSHYLVDKRPLPPKYDAIGPFPEGLAQVILHGKVGYVNIEGEVVVPIKYDLIGGFREGLAQVGLKGKYGFVDTTGKEVVPLKYDSAGPFSEGLAEVSLNGKGGFVDTAGKEVVPLKYGSTGPFSEGLAAVGLKSKYGFIDTTGNEVVPLKYSSTGSFREGLAEVSLNGKSGKIDRAGVWQGGPEPTRFGRYIKIVLFLLGMGLIILVLSVMEVIIRGTQ